MLSLLEQMRKRLLLRRYLLFFAAVIVFHSVIYYPVYLFLASDVAWKSSIVFFLWTEIAEPLSVYLFFWGSFAFLIYAGIRHSARATVPYLIVYAVGSVLRYALQNVCFIVMMGLPAWQRYFDLAEILWNILLDLLVMALVFVLLLLHLPRMCTGGKSPVENCLPVEGFFSLKNLLVRLSLLAAAVPSLAKIIVRASYDIQAVLLGGDTPSGAAEIFLMITYYVTDVLTALLGHLLIQLILSALHLSDVKARLRFEETDGREEKENERNSRKK